MTVNKDVINKLSRKLLKHNKTRNLFIIIAIVLSSTLFSIIFTSGLSIIKSFEEQTMRESGSTAHAYFADLSSDEYLKLSQHPSIKEFGLSIPISFVENEALKKRRTIIKYGDETMAKLSNTTPYMGTMPINGSDVVLDTIVLDYLELPYKLGQKILLEYLDDGVLVEEEFILSGISKGDVLAQLSVVWVSKDIAAQESFYLDIVFNNSFGIKNKVIDVIIESGYSINEIMVQPNRSYILTSLVFDIQSIVMTLLMLLVVIFTGYLIIYNIFSISITQDIKFYGMLKTIGTTPKQIRKIVRNQVVLLSIIGIPLGLAIGYLIAIILFPFIISSTNLEKVIFSLNPLIFILSGFFALITVYLGSKKPAKIASKITPIMALKYQYVSNKKSSRKSNNSKIYKLAWNNIMRNKKNSIIIVVTLFLSIIILNSSFAIVKGLNFDTFISSMIKSDFSLASNRYYSYNFDEMTDGVSEGAIKEIRDSNLITDDCEIYFNRTFHKLSNEGLENYMSFYDGKEEYFENESKIVEQYISGMNDLPAYIYGMNTYGISKLEIREGKLDIPKFLSGDYVIVGAFTTKGEFSSYSVGDYITLDISGSSKNYEVMAVCNIPYSLSVMHYEVGSIDLVLPSNEFSTPAIMNYIFDVKSDSLDEMEKLLIDYTRNIDTSLNYQSKATYLNEFKDLSNMYIIVGGTVAFIIGLIGIANFINSILTGIATRKMELAMFKSIGMTNKQLEAMLAYEGLYYGTATIVLSLTVGHMINYLFVEAIAGQIWFFEYNFTYLPIIIMSPVILLVTILVPKLSNKNLKKINVIEQLRKTE